jgi:hypothetical protein
MKPPIGMLSLVKPSEDEIRYFWKLPLEDRIEGMWQGRFKLTMLLKWASRCPQQVPLVNNEFAFIEMFCE